MNKDNKPNMAVRAYGAGVRATNMVSVLPWILFVLMLLSWLGGR